MPLYSQNSEAGVVFEYPFGLYWGGSPLFEYVLMMISVSFEHSSVIMHNMPLDRT